VLIERSLLAGAITAGASLARTFYHRLHHYMVFDLDFDLAFDLGFVSHYL
jgi:hypothetical protein